MKRGFVLLVAMSLLMSVFAGCANKEVVKDTEPTVLVVSTWGFNEDALRRNVFEPFEKANNVEIVLEVGNNADRLNKIRMKEESEVDLIILAESFAIKGIKEGLFETINRNNIPNIQNIHEFAQMPNGENYGPAYTLNRTGIVYDAAMLDFEVASWADLWRSELANNLSIPGITTTAGPAMVLLAGDLVGENPLENSDAAFAKLVELKPNLVKTYARSSELVNMFIQGEIIAGVAQDFAFGRIKEAVPTAVWVDPKEGAFANLNTINIVKGTNNKELAEKLIDWWLSEEVQRANALDKIDSPVNVNVMLTEEEAAGLTYGDELISSLQIIDRNKVNIVINDWINRWNREVAN